MFDKHIFPDAKLSSQQCNITPDLQAKIRTVADEVSLDESDKQCLRDLRLIDPRHEKQRIEARKDPLLEGSCSWVLKDPAFVDWWTCDDSRLLWIHGNPGKGKTMMMIALISEVSKRLKTLPGSNVLAYFFCQNDSRNLKTTVSVLRGLIYHLVDQKRMLIRHLRERYDSAGKQLFTDSSALWALQDMLLNILKDRSLGNVYLMVDALDECDPEIQELLDWIFSKNSEVSPKIKWLMTSRNELPFKEKLGHSHQLHTSLELNSSHVAGDVANFIDSKIRELADLKQYSSDLREFVRKSLHEKSEGTFLWVALVCKDLRDVGRQEAKFLLEETPAGLKPLYERMLYRVLHQKYEKHIGLCRQILWSVTLTFRPLRLEEIAVCAKIPEVYNDPSDLEELLSRCGSFITIRDHIAYLIHQSAKDFLSTDASLFPSGIEVVHHTMFSRSLEIMSQVLRYDIYNLHAPGFPIEEVVPLDPDPLAAVHYSCVYWVDHLRDGKGQSSNSKDELADDGLISTFFKSRFLYWLETLSLLGKISEGVRAIQLLEGMVDASKRLYAFIYDAKRFVLYNRSVTEKALLQLYCSALIFAPEKSIVRETFKKYIPTWIERKSRVQAYWSAALQTLEGHSKSVRSVAFSPDGKRIVSGSADRTVRLWDAITGAALQTFEGHSESVRSVAFSPDNKRIVSGSDDQTVRLWDAITGAALQTLEGHSSSVRSVAFSPDGKLLPTLHVFDDWLTEDTTKFLWLPIEYRPTCQAVHDKLVILGHSSGRISILQIKYGLKLITSS